jgi:hypothetical protein
MRFADASQNFPNTVNEENSIVQCHFRCFEDPMLTTVDVETNQQRVPCWLGARWLPQLAELGPRATFAGRFGIDPVSEKNIGRVRGRFEKVSLPDQYAMTDTDPAVGRRKPHNGLGAMEVDMAFDDNSRRRIAAGQPLQITATLELPDGSRHPVVPEYHFQQVLNIGSAISKTVRTARSRSASNHYK